MGLDSRTSAMRISFNKPGYGEENLEASIMISNATESSGIKPVRALESLGLGLFGGGSLARWCSLGLLVYMRARMDGRYRDYSVLLE